MAEAVGVIASAITIVQLTEYAAKLRRLWKEARRAPEEITELLDEIETIKSLLDNVQLLRHDYGGRKPAPIFWERCLKACQVATQALQTIVSEWQAKLHSHPVRVALRVVASKEAIADLRSKIGSAKLNLILAQQYFVSEKLDYISKSQSAEFTKIRDILTLVAPPVTLLSQGPFSSHQALGAILQPKYTSPLRRKGSSRDPRNTVQLQRSVWQTPTYIFGRIWEIQLSKATSGWTWTINPYNVIADNAIAIRYAQNGDIAALLGLFAAGQASISDRDYRFGASLLHHAAEWGQLDMCKFLLASGATCDATDSRNRSVMKYLDFYQIRLATSGLSPSKISQLPTNIQRATIHCKAGFASDNSNHIHDLFRLFMEWDCDEFYDETSCENIMATFRGPAESLKLLQERCEYSYNAISLAQRVLMSTFHGGDVPEKWKLILCSFRPLSLDLFEVAAGHNFNLFCNLARKFGCAYAHRTCCAYHRAAIVGWRQNLREAVAIGAVDTAFKNSMSPMRAFMQGYFAEPLSEIIDYSGVLRMWLQEVVGAGLSLEDYGAWETSLFDAGEAISFFRSGDVYQLGTDNQPTSVRITQFTFGHTPADWRLTSVEESNSIYNQDSESGGTEVKIPGSWPALQAT